MALGLTLGIILAISSGNTTKIAQSALGASASPSASASGAAAAAAAAPSAPAAAAAASANTGAAANAATAATFAVPANNAANRAGLAGANAVDAAGNTFSFNQNADQAAASMNCTVSVPANPLSAQGLASPWILGDGCTWANGGTEGVFVDATILSPNGQLEVYDPLVINQGTTPAVAPAPPTIAAGSQVILSVGFNGNGLALVGPGVRQGNCIDAFGNSLINQTPQCNAASFYRLANAEIARGTLTIPAAGTGKDGQACPTTRDFALIDQDQSDNAVAHYLFDPVTGQSAQDTAANQAAMAGATVEANGSDNGLLDGFVDPALGCTPFTAPNTTNPAGAERVAGAERAVRPGRTRRARSRCSRSTTRSCWSTASSASARPTPTGSRPTSGRCRSTRTPAERGGVLPEHGQHPDAQAEAGCGHGNRHRLARPGARQQPGQLPRGPAERLVRQPELPELRPDQPGHADARRRTASRPPRPSAPRSRPPRSPAPPPGAGAGRGGGGARNRGNFMPGRRGHV